MRTIVALSALMLGLSVGAASAQIATGDTQTPPAPNAGAQAVESVNSLPSGSVTGTQYRAGSDVGTTRVAPANPAPVR